MKDVTEARPRLALSLFPGDRALEAVAALSLLLFLVVAGVGWSDMPSRVPLHFGFSGEADSWGSRNVALILPGIAILLYALLTAVAAAPHIYNYPWPITADNAERQYRLARRLVLLLKNVMVLLFLAIYIAVWRTALGTQSGLTVWFLPIVFLCIAAVVAWYFAAARRAR